MPRKREPASKRTALTAKRKPATRKPKSSPELRRAAEQARARGEQLGRLYQPLHEAGQAELEKTAAGRKLLEEARALGTETHELYKNIASGRTPYEEGQRLLRRRSEEFRERHKERYLEAYGRHAHLQPSVEAIVQILEPETAADRAWVSETAFLQALSLRPKPAPEEIETVSRGLGDPAPGPQPVASCLVPPFDHREDGYGYVAPLGESLSEANVDGNLFDIGTAWSVFGVPEATRMESWVGGDFAVPAGISSYHLSVDYDFLYFLSGWIGAGFGTASVGVVMAVDKGDGKREKFTGTTDWNTFTAPWYVEFMRNGNVRLTVPFTRDGSSAGKVRALVGLAADSFAVAPLWGLTSAFTRVLVREICLTSAV
jgi:hypothetical protein